MAFFSKKEYLKTRTFTYYIPAPPARKTGYQEKEFDKLTKYLQDLGFELLDFKMQSHSDENRAGLWVLCLLGAKNEELYSMPINIEKIPDLGFGQHSEHHIPLNPEIIHEAD